MGQPEPPGRMEVLHLSTACLKVNLLHAPRLTSTLVVHQPPWPSAEAQVPNQVLKGRLECKPGAFHRVHCAPGHCHRADGGVQMVTLRKRLQHELDGYYSNYKYH